MFWLKFISKFIKVLRSGESPSLVAGGFTIGFMVGLTPLLTFQNILLLMIAILTKVNLASVFFAIFLFSFVAYLFDPLFHELGYFLLVHVESLQGLWTMVNNWHIAPFSRFYNTVVMGSFASAAILCFPIFALSKSGIIAYRKSWAEKVASSKLVRAVKGSPLFKIYVKLRDLEW